MTTTSDHYPPLNKQSSLSGGQGRHTGGNRGLGVHGKRANKDVEQMDLERSPQRTLCHAPACRHSGKWDANFSLVHLFDNYSRTTGSKVFLVRVADSMGTVQIYCCSLHSKHSQLMMPPSPRGSDRVREFKTRPDSSLQPRSCLDQGPDCWCSAGELQPIH